MDEKSSERARAVPSLAAALRSARTEAAEQSQALANLRGAEIGRLHLLREALEPVFAQLPEGIDMFDTGVVPGEHPRLFVDMIAFVDMARDRRTYRFHLDTRHGRVLVAETEGVQAMAGKITDYIARRLVEREAALSSLTPEGLAMRPRSRAASALSAPATAPPPLPPPPHPASRNAVETRFGRLVRIAIQGLGVVAFLWLGMHVVQGRLPGW